MDTAKSWAFEVVQLSYTAKYLLLRCNQLKRLDRAGLARFGLWTFLDFFLGHCAMSYVHEYAENANNESLESMAFSGADTVVYYLRRLITWLMGAPAGFKLNSVFSMCLGKFFLYHIHLWVTFLHQTTPYVSYLLTHYYCLSILSQLGICFQVCVVQDALNVITFHVHCFYAYARRLYASQTSGLRSLWRLFRGKKYNPLRDRVDTSSNSVDQLFLGTLAFTIMLFLYPTTIIYFAVFQVLEFALSTVVNGSIFAVTRIFAGWAVRPPDFNPIVWTTD